MKKEIISSYCVTFIDEDNLKIPREPVRSSILKFDELIYDSDDSVRVCTEDYTARPFWGDKGDVSRFCLCQWKSKRNRNLFWVRTFGFYINTSIPQNVGMLPFDWPCSAIYDNYMLFTLEKPITRRQYQELSNVISNKMKDYRVGWPMYNIFPRGIEYPLKVDYLGKRVSILELSEVTKFNFSWK
jgi:hypothetical protein